MAGLDRLASDTGDVRSISGKRRPQLLVAVPGDLPILRFSVHLSWLVRPCLIDGWTNSVRHLDRDRLSASRPANLDDDRADPVCGVQPVADESNLCVARKVPRAP